MPKEPRTAVDGPTTRDIVEMVVVALVDGIPLPKVGNTAKLVTDIGAYVGSVFEPSKFIWSQIRGVKRKLAVRKSFPLRGDDFRPKDMHKKATRHCIGEMETSTDWMGYLRTTLISADCSDARDEQIAWILLLSLSVLIFRLAVNYCNGGDSACRIDGQDAEIIKKYVSKFETWTKSDKANESWGKLIAFVLNTEQFGGSIVIHCLCFLSKERLNQFKAQFERAKEHIQTESIHNWDE